MRSDSNATVRCELALLLTLENTSFIYLLTFSCIFYDAIETLEKRHGIIVKHIALSLVIATHKNSNSLLVASVAL